MPALVPMLVLMLMLMLVLVLVIGGERVDEVPCLICPRTGSGETRYRAREGYSRRVLVALSLISPARLPRWLKNWQRRNGNCTLIRQRPCAALCDLLTLRRDG